MKPSSWIARLLAVGGAVGLVGVARSVMARRAVVAAVAGELRTPALYLPISFSNDVALKVARTATPKPAAVRPGVITREVHVPSAAGPVRVLVHERADRDRRAGAVGALLWIHGGGLIMGTPEQGNDLCSHLVAELGIVVAAVAYRLAPEHPFPAGLDDCAAALDWLAADANGLGIDPARLAVGGDSAGGGLAACVAQVAHDRGGPSLQLQLLQYPMLDDRTVLRSTSPTTLVWSPASNRYAWSAYLGHPPTEREDRPYASAARRSDLGGLPPAWIGVGDIDLFHDEDLDYARRLREAGVEVELHVEPGMYHAADVFAAGSPSMQAFRQRMIDAVRAAIG